MFGFPATGSILHAQVPFGLRVIGLTAEVDTFGSKVTGDNHKPIGPFETRDLNSATMWHLVVERAKLQGRGCETELPIRKPQISTD